MHTVLILITNTEDVELEVYNTTVILFLVNIFMPITTKLMVGIFFILFWKLLKSHIQKIDNRKTMVTGYDKSNTCICES